MIKITIDSNLINVKQKIDPVNRLEELHQMGKIKIVGAERLSEEMRKFKNSDALAKASNYENIGEPFVVGYSRIGHAYIASDNPKLQTFKEVAEILFPNIDINTLNDNQSSDVIHILGHSHSDSEYFITNNTKDFIDGKKTNLNRNENLTNHTRKRLESLGIKVLTPNEAVILLDNK